MQSAVSPAFCQHTQHAVPARSTGEVLLRHAGGLLAAMAQQVPAAGQCTYLLPPQAIAAPDSAARLVKCASAGLPLTVTHKSAGDVDVSFQMTHGPGPGELRSPVRQCSKDGVDKATVPTDFSVSVRLQCHIALTRRRCQLTSPSRCARNVKLRCAHVCARCAACARYTQ